MTAIAVSLYRLKEYLRTGAQSTATTRPSITSLCEDLETAMRTAVASATRKGFVELATDAETITGTDDTRAVTPAGLAALTATTARDGLVELATDAEAITGTDATRAATPANLAAAVATHVPTASEGAAGKAELATLAETKAGTDAVRIVTPINLAAVLDACKIITFAGKNGAGACTAVGAAVGDKVIGVACITNGSMGAADASFEATITIVDQIQQSAAGDLSTKDYIVLLRAVA